MTFLNTRKSLLRWTSAALLLVLIWMLWWDWAEFTPSAQTAFSVLASLGSMGLSLPINFDNGLSIADLSSLLADVNEAVSSLSELLGSMLPPDAVSMLESLALLHILCMAFFVLTVAALALALYGRLRDCVLPFEWLFVPLMLAWSLFFAVLCSSINQTTQSAGLGKLLQTGPATVFAPLLAIAALFLWYLTEAEFAASMQDSLRNCVQATARSIRTAAELFSDPFISVPTLCGLASIAFLVYASVNYK